MLGTLDSIVLGLLLIFIGVLLGMVVKEELVKKAKERKAGGLPKFLRPSQQLRSKGHKKWRHLITCVVCGRKRWTAYKDICESCYMRELRKTRAMG